MLKYIIEIKKRLLLAVLSFLCTTTITYYYKEIIFFIIINTCNKSSGLSYFIVTDIREILIVHYCLIKFIWLQTFGIYTFYSCFGFLALSFFKKEYFFVQSLLKIFLFIFFIFLFILGNVIIPLSFKFLLSFQELVKFSLKLNFEAKLLEFFDFYSSFFSLSFNCFQLIVILLLILYYVNLKKTIIKKYWKLFYCCFAIGITLITSEIYTQIIFSLIFIFISEFVLIGFMIKINLN